MEAYRGQDSLDLAIHPLAKPQLFARRPGQLAPDHGAAGSGQPLPAPLLDGEHFL